MDDSGGEGNTCSSQTGLGYPTDKGDAGGGQGAQPHQRCSKRLVTSCGDEERNRAKPHDKVLRSHTRRANSSSGVVGLASEKQVAVAKQRAISVTKRGRDQEWSELRGLVIPSSSSCSTPTNETVELCEQAGLGGTTHAKALESTTSASTRRTSGARRRRSRRGEHCSQPDVTTQSTTNTTITTSNSNNTSASPQVMSSVVGGSEKGRISEEYCDEPETMCQEDDAPVPRCHPSASNSPKSFASSIVSEGAAPASARSELGSRHYPNNNNINNNNPLSRGEQDAETEETPSMQTVVKVENENWEIVNVKGESCARASVGRKGVSKGGHSQSTKQSGGNGSNRGEFEVIHRGKKHCDRSNVEDGRGDEKRTQEENPEESHPQSIRGDVSMPLLRTDDVGKGATEACVVPAPLPSSSTSSFKLSSSSTSATARNLRKTGGASSGQKKHEGHLPPVNKSGCGKCEVSGSRDKGSVIEKKKIVTTPAPMLLMNNLPYMGELTFDTRPRRGRKPKKADICHLISKNYGIHFPVSYLNLAAAAAAAPTVPPPSLPPHLTSAHGHSTKSSQKRVNNGNANNNASTSISLVGSGPAPAFCNKDVSIVPIIPSSWSPSGGRAQGKAPISSGKNLAKPLSLAQQLSLLRPNSSSQQAISMFPIPNALPSSSQSRGQLAYKSEEDEDEGDGGGNGLQQNRMDDCQEDGKGNQDSPLNLCMRDSRFKTITLPFVGSKREVEERSTLDVRWSKSTRNLDQAQFGSSSFSPTVQLGASKRMVLPPEGEGMVRKACKSAKLSGTQASNTNTNNSYRNSYRSNSSSLGVNNLVRIESIPSSSSFSMSQQRLLDGRATPPYGIPASATSSTASSSGGKSGKQHGGSSRKKKELGLRGDIRVSPCNSEASTGATTSTVGSCGGTGPGGFSSFGGGTLFGQSTSGINEGAEVSICKFKFTGGAKPCLQEKKMLSVDSGGNFRFYTDKSAGGTTSKMGKQQPSTSSSTVTSYSTSVTSGTHPSGGEFSADGTATECHLPMSSLPKSAKSMSMCMPYAGNTPGVSTITSTATKATTSSSTIASASLSLPLPISPTVDELQQLHLSINHAGQQNTRESSPYLPGEYSYSSSNSCSSSDNSNENLMQGESGVKMAVSPKSRFNSHPGAYHRHSTGGKLKRKRRTRKSLMREKLEKTFKEKGFLIQTQQLESAEGATYCKFRQLRKFTRYLFRSWKDYLPDHVKEISDKSNNGNTNGANLPGSSQSALQSPSASDGKSGVKEELVEEGQSTMQGITGDVGEEDEDMDTSDKEETETEDRELGLISKKMTEGGSASSDEDVDEEDRVVLIEASRAQSQSQSPIPRLTQPHPSLSTGPNEMGDDEASDEDEEELQVDS